MAGEEENNVSGWGGIPSSDQRPFGTAGTRVSAGRPGARCTPPEQVFGTASALAVFLWQHLDTTEVQTLINLLTFLTEALSVLVIQRQLCEGVSVTPSEP